MWRIPLLLLFLAAQGCSGGGNNGDGGLPDGTDGGDGDGGSMPANLESGQATVAGTTRSADDCFSLVYSAVHHNWNEGYTILLRPPIGDVHGLVLIDAGLNDDPVEMLYLGSDLTQIRVSPLTSYSEVKQ